MIQLMIADADQIDVLLLNNVESVFPLGIRTVVEAVSFDPVAGVDE